MPDSIRSGQAPLHILMLANEYPPVMSGGLGTHVYELSRGLVRQGNRVTVLVPHTRPMIRDDEGVSVHYVRTWGNILILPGIMQYATDRGLAVYARALFERTGDVPDLIHLHDWFRHGTATRLVETLGCPYVETAHLLNHPLRKWNGERRQPKFEAMERRIFAQADGIIAVSEAMGGLIQSEFGVESDRLFVVHNGMDFKPFVERPEGFEAALEAKRAELGLNGCKVAFFAGRLVAQKGIVEVIQTAANMLGRHADLHFVIAGGPLNRSNRKLVNWVHRQNPEWAERIHLLGQVPREMVCLLYGLADYALVPSRFEPFGYAAIEAMAAGVPVVASNSGGLAEIIENERTGLLVDVVPDEYDTLMPNVNQLTVMQERLIFDRKFATKLANAARQAVLERFDVTNMVSKTIQVYDSVLNRTNRR